MSVDGIKWCIEVNKRTDLHPRVKAVALVLGDHHNGRTGQCTPGQWTIFSEAGLPRRTAQRGIRELREAGLIDVQARQRTTGRGRTSDTYELLPINGVAPKVWEHHPDWEDDWVGTGPRAASLPDKTNAPSTAQWSSRTNAPKATTNAPPVTDQCATSAPEHGREQGSEHGTRATTAVEASVCSGSPSVRPNPEGEFVASREEQNTATGGNNQLGPTGQLPTKQIHDPYLGDLTLVGESTIRFWDD
jgi:hypothetical protein